MLQSPPPHPPHHLLLGPKDYVHRNSPPLPPPSFQPPLHTFHACEAPRKEGMEDCKVGKRVPCSTALHGARVPAAARVAPLGWAAAFMAH